jgi:crossover junction endodeoxyribonuclease RuvC
VTRVKKAVVGRGNASKFQVQRMVQEFLKLKTTPEPTDVSDALALAIAHGFIFKKQDLNKR